MPPAAARFAGAVDGLSSRPCAPIWGRARRRSIAPSMPKSSDHALRDAIQIIRRQAEDAVRGGATHVILSDERAGPGRAAIPMILATGAVHVHLLRQQLRTFTSLNVRTGEMPGRASFRRAGRRRRHHGERLCGGSLDRRPPGPRVVRQAQTSTNVWTGIRYAVDQGLLKVMSKMGIAVVSRPTAAAPISRRWDCRARSSPSIFPTCRRASPASA